jgi:hypothetical protein
MKQTFLFLALLLVLAGCKKDKEKPAEILLTEIKLNGVVTTRMEYSSDNKFTRLENFSAGVLSSRFVFEYDADGHISVLTTYGFPGETPFQRVVFECDDQGNVKGTTNYDMLGGSPNTPIAKSTFTYNATGHITSVQSRDNDNILIYTQNFLYYPDGNLKETQLWRPSGNQLWMSNKSAYSIADDFQANGIDQLTGILGPDYVASLFSESAHNYTYNEGGVLLTHTNRLRSGHEFNENGSLRKQAQTTVFLKPIKPMEAAYLEYEYLVQ